MAIGFNRRRTAGSYLSWKVRFFSVGAALAMAGMFLQERWMTMVAIPVLLAGVFVRFLPGGSGESTDHEDEDEGDA